MTVFKKVVMKLRADGHTYQYIGDMLGVTRQRIHQIVTGYKSPTQCLFGEIAALRKCFICHETKRVIVHHLDANRKNNKESNLRPVCYRCHMALHRRINTLANRLLT